MIFDDVQKAVSVIRAKLPADFSPKLSIILGSGLGRLADHVDQVGVIPYSDIPGFHMSTVKGHAGHLVAGYLEGLPVLCLQGRVHFYEGASVHALRVMIYSLRFMGCEALFLASACGSLDPEVGPGELRFMKDHINFQGINPLVGPNDERLGQRFVPMDNAYDQDLRASLHQAAQALDIKVGSDAVYFGVLGPTFETPAEIRAYRILGADVIGMSTVGEVILANHCGLKVAGIAVISNFAAGLAKKTITHEEHVAVTDKLSGVLTKLVKKFAVDMLENNK